MVELFDAEPSLLTYFKSQPVKKEIIRRLAQNVSLSGLISSCKDA